MRTFRSQGGGPDITPDQRRRKIASILAKGVLWLGHIPQRSPESVPELQHQKPLDVPNTTRPHVARG